MSFLYFYVAYHITRIISDKQRDQSSLYSTTTPLSGLSQRPEIYGGGSIFFTFYFDVSGDWFLKC